MHVVSNRNCLKMIYINNIDGLCLVETGSEGLIIKQYVTQKIKGVPIKSSQKVLRGLGNKETQPVGYFIAEVTVDNIDMSHDALLGYDFHDWASFWQFNNYFKAVSGICEVISAFMSLRGNKR